MADSSTNKNGSLDGVIAINVAAQLPIKLNKNNFPLWKAQFDALLHGYDLMSFLDSSKPCPAKNTVDKDGVSCLNPDFAIWNRQDKLLLHAIIASVSENVVPLIATSVTSHDAWTKLHKLFANKSRSRIMNLKEKLTNITCDTQPVADYLQAIKGIADELALADTPLSDDDLAIFALNGLGSNFKEISAAIRARDQPISFEELHDKLVEHETFLKREENRSGPSITVHATGAQMKSARAGGQGNAQQTFRQNGGRIFSGKMSSSNSGSTGFTHGNQVVNNSQFVNNSRSSRPNVVCQFCQKRGHTARQCFTLKRSLQQQPELHHTTTGNAKTSWIMDSGASHHVTNDLTTLSQPQPYEGPDDIFLGDGSGLSITNTGSSNGGATRTRAE